MVEEQKKESKVTGEDIMRLTPCICEDKKNREFETIRAEGGWSAKICKKCSGFSIRGQPVGQG